MKRVSKLLSVIILTVLMTSCADSKTFAINGKKETIEPYGGFDLGSKHDSIQYKMNTGNIILSVVFGELIIPPILLTGDQLYESVRKK